MENDKNKSEESRKPHMRGMAVGIAIGAGIGIAMGNLAIGIGAGIALGAGIGLLRSKRDKDQLE